MNLCEFAEEQRRRLWDEFEEYLKTHKMRRGMSLAISGQMTPQKIDVKVKVAGDTKVKDHPAASMEQLEFLNKIKFPNRLEKIVDHFLLSHNSPCKWGDLLDMAATCAHTVQINKILRKEGSSVELRAAVWDENGNKIPTWNQLVCFRVIRSSESKQS